MPLFGNNANFQGNQAINMAAEVLGSAPGTAVVGRIYYDTGAGALKVCTNATGPVFTTLGAGPSFTTNTITLSATAGAGSSGSVIRADSVIAAFDATTPTVSAVGDSAAVGSAAFAARRDHTHGREAFGAVTAATTFGTSSANGTALTEARADHTHGTPTHLSADHTAVTLNSLAVPTGAVSMNSQNITNLLDPTSAQMAATKNYVDATSQGLSPKPSAFLATAAALPANTNTAGVLTASGNAALTVDGTAVTVGQNILVKNEVASQDNGLFVVTATGSGAAPFVLTRHSSMDSATEVPGAFIFVESGTANGSTGWVVSSPTAATAFTINTTAITFTQFSGAGTYAAGTGLTLTGTSFSISATYIGQSTITTLGIIGTGTWQATAVGIAYGGTAQTTAAAARGTSGLGSGLTAPTSGSGGVVSSSNAGIPTKILATIGDGTTTSILITHNLGTTDLTVAVYSATTPYAEVIADVQHTSTNTITIVFATAPTASQYKCVLVG